MSLPHALLGLINYRPSTGYDLKATFKRSIYFFWNATLPQIYRTLNHMESKGWLTSTVEHQKGKPSRKVYYVTDTGRQEFFRWLAEPAEIVEPRQPMLVKVFFGNQLAPDQIAGHLERWREYHAGLLKKYEKEAEPAIEQYAPLTGASEDAYYWKLTLDFGRRRAQMIIDWCDQILRTLDRRKRQKESLVSVSQKRKRA
jgi:PadR family transcriptional regulator AphA